MIKCLYCYCDCDVVFIHTIVFRESSLEALTAIIQPGLYYLHKFIALHTKIEIFIFVTFFYSKLLVKSVGGKQLFTHI